jgi:DNA-binding transcriptional LysR family regulator
MLNEIDLSRIDLNLLVLFQVVLDERHVGRAASRLSLSPSAVSHGLGRLRRLLHDPLFLRTPKGVVPTTRAVQLAEPVADILARVKNVISTAEPFDPATSTRRFTIGAPDGVSAVVLDTLLAKLGCVAPRIDIGVRQLLPSPSRVWHSAIGDLEARAMDIAVIPTGDIPLRFEKRLIYEENFVVAVRAGHPFVDEPSLEKYCEMQHLVVSESGDSFGFVDEQLAKRGMVRRVALTVPNFLFAISVIAGSDFIGALPRRFVAMYAARFGVRALDPPLSLPRFQLNAVTPKVAMMDAGLAWMFNVLVQTREAAREPMLSPPESLTERDCESASSVAGGI